MQAATGTSTRFLLIHGSWHGSWCWERLEPLLEGRALALRLPGRESHGPRGLDMITLADWVDAVVAAGHNLEGQDLVLVAHSMGAIVLPAVAARLAGQVRHVVYVAGLAPDEGRCGADMFMPRLPWSVGPLTRAPAGGTLPSRPALRYMLCNDLDPATTAWLLDRVQPTPTRPSLTRVTWRGFRWPCPVTYIRGRRDRALTRGAQERSLRNLGEARFHEIDCGHEIMLARPDALAALLHTL